MNRQTLIDEAQALEVEARRAHKAGDFGRRNARYLQARRLYLDAGLTGLARFCERQASRPADAEAREMCLATLRATGHELVGAYIAEAEAELGPGVWAATWPSPEDADDLIDDFDSYCDEHEAAAVARASDGTVTVLA
jgi:hypothetical protein